MKSKILFFYTFLFISLSVYSQGFNSEFGQNRRNQKQFDWKVMESNNVTVYYYDSAVGLASFALKNAEKQLEKMEAVLDYKIEDKIKILVYNSPSDLYESNYGLEENQVNTGGYVYAIENKAVVAFNADHYEFLVKMNEGIAEVLLNDLLYGGTLKEKVQASTLLFIPPWYFKGLSRYLSQKWNTKYDNDLKHLYFSKKLNHFNWLDNEEAIVAGHALWNYLVEKNGEKNISEMLYYTRIARNYEMAFEYVLGKNTREIMSDWNAYLSKMYTGSSELNAQKIKKFKENFIATALTQNPANKRLLITYSNNKYWKIGLYNNKNDISKVVYTGKNSQLNNKIQYINAPLVKWSPDGKKLYVIDKKISGYEIYEMDSRYRIKNTTKLYDFIKIDFIQSFSVSDSGIYMVATVNGITDIYLLNEENNIKNITEDEADEKDIYITSQNEILYASNNFNSQNLKQIPFYDIFILKNGIKKQLTFTDSINEIKPLEYKNRVTFISDISGVDNAYIINDTSKNALNSGNNILPITDFNYDIISREISNVNAEEYYLLKYGQQYSLVEIPLSDNIIEDSKDLEVPVSTFRMRTNAPTTYSFFEYFKEIPVQKTNDNIDTNFYITNPSDSLLEFTDSSITLIDSSKLKKEEPGFQINVPIVKGRETYDIATLSQLNADKNAFRKKPFYNTVYPKYLVTQFDNSIIGTNYYQPDFAKEMASMQILVNVKGGISDVFGDQKLSGGIRLPLSLTGSDVYLNYDNKKSKIDWGLDYFRLSRRYNNEFSYQRLTVNIFNARFALPITDKLRWDWSAGTRVDTRLELNLDSTSLNIPDQQKQMVLFKTGFTFDDTKNIDINLLEGNKIKLYGESFYQVTSANKYGIILGIDARKYIKVHKKIVWANRFTFNSSIGTTPVQYVIGGVENWIGRSTYEDIGISNDAKFEFRSYANSLRGFKQNIRNGNNYFIFNTELRFPVALYLTKTPIVKDFFRNLLLVAFMDAGMAWSGPFPIGEQAYNTTTISGQAISATVTNLYNPLVGSGGFGLRSRFFSYYLKLDVAWGRANTVWQKGFAQVSLGYDF